jgi:hypothetical protein
MFTLLLFQVYCTPYCSPDLYAPFYVEKHLSQSKCHKRGEFFKNKFYGELVKIEYVCIKERRVKE